MKTINTERLKGLGLLGKARQLFGTENESNLSIDFRINGLDFNAIIKDI